MPRNSTSMVAGGQAGAANRRSASTASKAWLGAVLQTVREGSAVAVQTLLTDLRADGHVVTSAEAEMVETPAIDTDQELDVEIDLGEEDEVAFETWDEVSTNPEFAASVPGDASVESQGSILIGSGWEIIVEEDACRLHVPPWVGLESRTDFGQRILDELTNRLTVLNRVARWLSEARKQFLLTCDAWELGRNALNELRAGQVPVSPQSFLEFTGIGKCAKPESFSRYTRDCFLIWPAATASLSVLFDLRARHAWVGNIIKQLSAEQGRIQSVRDLEQLRRITKPRTRDAKQRVMAASVDSLGFSEVLIRATLLAGVGCSEVLEEFGERILINNHE